MKNDFYKWELLILLWFAFFLNQADRQIFNVVLPLIKADLKLSDADLGLISSALIWTYGLFVPIAGWAGDRLSRRKIITYSLFFWSLATLMTGLGTNLLYFILIRGIATGGGEGFYAPTANALISEYHTKTRAFALSLHQTAVYIGIVSSGLLAGYVGEHYGWRVAFYLFGGFGVVLSLVLFFRLKNSTKTVSEKELNISLVDNYEEKLVNNDSENVLEVSKGILQKPTFWCLSLAFSCMVFVNVAYVTWTPTFLYEKFELSLTNAGFSSMFYHHISAFLGVLVGGWLSDKLAKQTPKYRFLIQAVAFMCASPFIFWLGQAESLWVLYLALGIFGFFRGIYDSNIFASLYEIVAPQQRATASGLILMIAFLTGAISPYLLALLKPILGFSLSLSLLSIFYVLAAGFMFLGTVFFNKDKAIL